jgi:hypothetical protein
MIIDLRVEWGSGARLVISAVDYGSLQDGQPTAGVSA